MGEPSNVGELRSFLCMVYQLEQVIPQLAKKFLSKKNCWVSVAEQARISESEGRADKPTCVSYV